MALRTLQRAAPGDWRPIVHEYGVLFVVVLASLLLQVLVVGSVDAAATRLPAVFGPQLVGGAMYATLGTLGLAAGYAAIRHLGYAPRLDLEERVSLAGVTVLVLFVVAFRLHGGADLPVVPEAILTGLLSGVVLGLVAVGYARFRDVDPRVGAPDRGALPLAAVVALTAGLAGLGWVLAVALGRDTPFVFAFGGASPPTFPLGALLGETLVPGVLVGAGTALLYNGAIQESLRDRLGPAGAVAAVTALTAGALVELRPIPATDAAGVVAGTALVVLLALLVAAVAAWTVRGLPRVVGVERTPLAAAVVGGVAVAVPLVALAATRGPAWWPVLYVATPVVAGTAAVGYERSRSVWVPALAFGTYLVVADATVTTYVARLLG
jgi:hypothetical protein